VSLGAAGVSLGASITFDLRYADGTHTKQGVAGGTYPVEAWVRVTGTNGDTSNEGLYLSSLVVASTQVDGGGITSGGLSNGQVAPPFNVSYAQNGQAVNTTNDGIVDWGGKTLQIYTDSTWLYAHAPDWVMGGGSVGNAVDANTWEFKVATFTLNMGILGSGTTKFDVINGAATPGPFGACYTAARVDGAFQLLSTNNPGTSFQESQGLSVVVPETVGLGVFSAFSVGMLLRVRRRGA
jgi:hypothetical protein